MRTAAAVYAVEQLADLPRIAPQTVWASSLVAVRPVPIALIGS
jgi:hypothetical protein